ncbi:MAG: PAS domain-containing protein, partial [Candidatus Aureabacteria bacterium]|nr:PAS domain-containing protein [Candidatus Auribacterota bacterium]
MNEDKKKAYILSHVVAESIISSMEDIFAVLDLEGKVQFVNETFQRILGYGEEDIVGQVLLEYFFSPEDDFMFEGRQSAVLTDNEFVKNYNIGIKAKNEKIMPFNISMTPIFNKDKEMIGTAFIGRDMRQMINILRQLKEIN